MLNKLKIPNYSNASRYLHMTGIACVALNLSSVLSFAVTREEALISQAASALASIDFASQNCATLKVNDKAVTLLIAKTNKSRETLMKHEDYLDQRNVLKSLAQENGKATVCFLMPVQYGPKASGSIRRDLLSTK